MEHPCECWCKCGCPEYKEANYATNWCLSCEEGNHEIPPPFPITEDGKPDFFHGDEEILWGIRMELA